jgi:hypothetical protein
LSVPKVGATVSYEGRSYRVRGFEPMSLPNRKAELEELATGARRWVPLNQLTPAEPGGLPPPEAQPQTEQAPGLGTRTLHPRG